MPKVMWLLVFALAMSLAACGQRKYVTPGGPADFCALGITHAQAEQNTDMDIEARMSRRPAASFPAAITVIRVQSNDYRSMTNAGVGRGGYSIVTVRDVENEEDIDRLAKLACVRELGPLNRLVVPAQLNDAKDVRLAASELQSDIVLLYTFDTRFASDITIPALGVISLGLLPNEVQRASCTASAAFIDTRSGFIYGVCEATANTDRLHNAWNSIEALDAARRKSEATAFSRLVGEVTDTWTDIVRRYGPPGAVPELPGRVGTERR